MKLQNPSSDLCHHVSFLSFHLVNIEEAELADCQEFISSMESSNNIFIKYLYEQSNTENTDPLTFKMVSRLISAISNVHKAHLL